MNAYYTGKRDPINCPANQPVLKVDDPQADAGYDQPKPTTGDIEARITAYLSAGGLFNPELMEHEKVRDLLMDCRAALAAEREKREQAEADLFNSANIAAENVKLASQLAAERAKLAARDLLIKQLNQEVEAKERRLAAEREKAMELCLRIDDLSVQLAVAREALTFYLNNDDNGQKAQRALSGRSGA